MIVKERIGKYQFFVAGNVRESRSEYDGQVRGNGHQIHDRLFKNLIHTYFEEFMELFFSKYHADIDFASMKPLSEEMFTDVFKGGKRHADIVIEAKLRGEDSLIIIHVEPQSTYDKNFPERMFQYYILLYNRYKKPILPIAVYSYDERREGQNSYEMTVLDFQTISFHFLNVQLSTMNWRKYLKSNNPVAAALLSKMNYTKSERSEVKRTFLRMIIKMKLPDESNEFLIRFFENYLKLDHEEEEELMAEMKYTDDWEEIKKLPISWEQIGIEKGREEGLEEGLKKGLEKGLEKGLDEGLKKGREEIALKLLEEGMEVSFVQKITELSEERIRELMEKDDREN